MAKDIIRVGGGESTFRIVIPHKIIKEMGWTGVKFLVVKKAAHDFLTIRRLFDEETRERQDH